MSIGLHGPSCVKTEVDPEINKMLTFLVSKLAHLSRKKSLIIHDALLPHRG